MATEVGLDTARFQKLFDSLETQKTLITICTEQWRNLSTHFSTLQQTLDSKTQTLTTKTQTLESQTQQTLQTLQTREDSVPEQESLAISRVEEQKQIALSALEKPEAEQNVTSTLEENVRGYCRKMDGGGLLKFVMSKRKESVVLKGLIEVAVKEDAVDAPRLVLDAVEEYVKVQKVAAKGDRRWACGMLVSVLFPVDQEKVEEKVFAGKIKERATVVAEAWKEKIDGEEGNALGHVEATMFLQLVVGFGLGKKFDEDFLRKLVLDYPSRRDMPRLAAALGFGEKMGDIIDELVKNGKEIEAVYFACECGLTERFPPVSLLNDYLKNMRKNATTILKNGHHSRAAQEEANTLELNSLKNIIRCVEEHKLETQFPLENLRRRVTQLEKLKVDRKKSAAANKRARADPTPFRGAKSGRVSHPYPSYGNRNTIPAHQNPAYSGSYNYPVQSVYDAPPATSYASPYGAHTRGSTALPQNYSYPPENISVAGGRIGGSYGAQTSYGAAYDYNSVAPTTYQPPYP